LPLLVRSIRFFTFHIFVKYACEFLESTTVDVFCFAYFFLSRVCTNSPTWTENILSLEDLPDSILEKLKCIHNVLTKAQNIPTGFTLDFLLGSFMRNADMLKFVRNAVLLCLTVFPRNHILEEAVLICEELYVTKMNSSNCLVTPCRTLAKSLLKSDRKVLIPLSLFSRLCL
jgi:hypothetical protein